MAGKWMIRRCCWCEGLKQSSCVFGRGHYALKSAVRAVWLRAKCAESESNLEEWWTWSGSVLHGVLIIRKLLILRIPKGPKMPSLPDRLYDFCTVNFSKPILAKSLPEVSLLRKTTLRSYSRCECEQILKIGDSVGCCKVRITDLIRATIGGGLRACVCLFAHASRKRRNNVKVTLIFAMLLSATTSVAA